MAFDGVTRMWPQSVAEFNRKSGGRPSAAAVRLRDWRDSVAAVPLGDAVHCVRGTTTTEVSGGVAGLAGARHAIIRVEQGSFILRRGPNVPVPGRIVLLPAGVDPDADTLTTTQPHGYRTGEAAFRVNDVLGGNELPAGLVQNGLYFFRVVDPLRVRLYHSRQDALRDENRVDILDDGGIGGLGLGGTMSYPLGTVGPTPPPASNFRGAAPVRVRAANQLRVSCGSFTVKGDTTDSKLLYWWTD